MVVHYLLLLVVCQLCVGFEPHPHYGPPPPPPHHHYGHHHRPPPPPSGVFNTGKQPIVFEESGESPSYRPRPGSPGRQGGMQVLYSWIFPDFTWPSEAAREEAIRSRRYIPNNTMILDVDVYESRSGRTVFVTLPRARPGVPVTLATVTNQKRSGANLLAPFPDWQSHTGDCGSSITSVFRTHVDDCGRLWVLDSGNNNVFAGASKIVCPPQVLIYDLNNNNRLIGKYHIPQNMVADNSLFVTIAVDVRRQDCSDSFAYIADSIAYKMIVFDLNKQEFWRINSVLFFPYPDQSRFNVDGVSFDLMGGIFGLAIGPLYRGNRRLYFHCIDSVKQSWVDTKEIRNNSLWKSNMNAKPRAFNLFSGTRSSQSAAATMNNEGIMFFGLLGSNEIACWNSRMQFSRRNIPILAKDDRTLQFNSGIKVYGDKLYVATSRLQNYVTQRVPQNEENYRVLVGDVVSLTRGTSCQVDPLNNRFEDEYMPDSESVDFDNNNFSFED
ncbi:protein yellow-like [Macrosteles quadrilineatus]|uniref:protein yellow-like n=1 Tax=Macrosteles quadrilineatus TaxID=74068 RepID=UPI0023E2EBE2|nr:protein yellow-like [Macrosteles quadrilineatus]